MTRVRWLVLIGIFLLPLWVVSAQEINWTGIIEAAKPAVVFIETNQGYGSGAIISPNGYILTAAHVIEGASWITVVVEDTREYRASVVQADYQMDVAVLKISATVLTWLKLGDSTQLHYEDEIRVLGYPLPAPTSEVGVGFVAVAGKVRGFRQRAYGILIQHDAPTEGGHSGAPVIDASAEIVGVHVGFIQGEVEAYRVAVAINDARRIIPSRAIPSGPSPVQPPTRPGVPSGPIRVPGDYPTISAALQAAPQGAEIHVSRGTYRGDLLVTRPVAITGEKGAVIQGNLTIQGAQNVTLNTVEIRGRVEIHNSTDVTISRVHVSGSPSIGVVIEDSTATISECQIEGSAGVGVDISFGGRVILRDCEIAETDGDGVRVSFGAQARIMDTSVRDCAGDGLEVSGATVELLGNRFVDNRGYGINAHSGATLLGERNRGQGNELGLASGEVPIEVASIQVPQEMSLGEAIREAGQTPILLAPGEYKLLGGTWIHNEVHIQGVGDDPEACVIKGLGAQGDRWVFVNLTLESAEIDATEARFSSCQVRNVKIGGSTQVELRDCLISKLSVQDMSQVTITDSRISGSPREGLSVGGSARVTLSAVEVSENRYGIGVGGSAEISLTDTTISGNGSGLCVGDEARGRLENITISRNERVGLSVRGLAQVSLLDCTVEGNGTDEFNDGGISVGDESRLTLRNCTVSKNVGYGLYDAKGEAQVRLENSTLSENKEGLAVYYRTQVSLEDCTINGNELDGLSVGGKARINLENSTISDNGENGLFVGDSSGSEAVAIITGGEISGNGEAGIRVWQSARVELRGEISIHDNSDAGIHVINPEAQVVGGPATMWGNGIPLRGFVSASIRRPLVPQTQRTELSVPGDYPTIQEAIDAIAPGGTITLAEGTFREAFTIWKSVTIRGAGPDSTVLTAPSGTPAVVAILAEAREVQVASLTITGVKERRWRPAAMHILGRVELMNIRVVDNEVPGIRSYGTARLTLRGCEISGNRGSGLSLCDQAQLETIEDTWISDNWGCGISLPEGGELRGRNNWVKYNYRDFCGCSPPEGFLLASPPRPLREGEIEVGPTCEFTQLREAIRAAAPGATIRLGPGRYSGPVMIAKDLVLIGAGPGRTRVAGIRIGGSAVVELRDLTISNPEEAGTGLFVDVEAQVTLINCSLSDNYYGLEVWGEAQVALRSCTISGNERDGLWVRGSTQVNLDNCTIEDNGLYGIFVMEEAHVTVFNCVIRNNADGGLIALLDKCGLSPGPRDKFTGEVILQNNKIYGNGMGDVCLPDLCLPEGACE